MTHVAVRGAVAPAGLVTFALLLAWAAGVPAAEAHHIDPQQQCQRKFGGTFERDIAVGIYARRTGARVGRVVLSRSRGGDQYCAVTVRRFHKRARYTGVRLKRYHPTKTPWRRNSSRIFTEFAGPVAVRIRQGECVRGRGQISRGWSRFAGCRGGTGQVQHGRHRTPPHHRAADAWWNQRDQQAAPKPPAGASTASAALGIASWPIWR